MAFLFPPEAAARLDSKERLSYVPVEKLLSCLPLKKGLRFVDVGCGTGTYFFPVFEKLQGAGVFIAVELQEEMLRRFFTRLEAYTQAPGFMSIEVARAKPERLPLPDSSADLILLADVYHEVAKRTAYLLELKRVLAPGGTLCILDWRRPEEDGSVVDEPLIGPPFEDRVAERQGVAELESVGFKWMVSHSGFIQNWCLTARR